MGEMTDAQLAELIGWIEEEADAQEIYWPKEPFRMKDLYEAMSDADRGCTHWEVVTGFWAGVAQGVLELTPELNIRRRREAGRE